MGIIQPEMKILLFLIVFSLYCIHLATSDNLVLVHAVWRHGDRVPDGTYKTDPYQESYWAQGWGQLTPLGMSQHVALGKRLREHYVDNLQFISPYYNSSEIHVRSTNLDRTLLSAISNMIGFYSKDDRSGIDFPVDKNWPANFVPVAVHTDSYEDEDVFIFFDELCPRKGLINKLIEQTEEYIKVVADYEWLFDTLTENCGEKVDMNNRIGIVDMALHIEELRNLTLPEWAQNETIRTAIKHINLIRDLMYDGIGIKPLNGVNFEIELTRLRGGPLIWHIISNMREKVKCILGEKDAPNSQLCSWMRRMKYFVLSAHETNLATLCQIFGLKRSKSNKEEFPYAAAMTFELWQRPNDSFYVKALYWLPDEPIRDLTESIQGCESGCDLEQFAKRSEIYRPIPSAKEYCYNLDLNMGSNALSNGPLKMNFITIFVIFILIFSSNLIF